MSARSDVLLWAQRVLARKGSPAHVLLEVREDATPDEAQAAFHKIARSSHPDLHRNGLSVDELEAVTSAYAAVAGAYMEVRSQKPQTARMRAIPPDAPDAAAPAASPAPRPGNPVRTPSSGAPTAPRPPAGPEPTGHRPAPPANLNDAMSAKAITYYRKAEERLGRGDLKGAQLQLKLAISADPASTFLRSTLAEIDAELRRST